MKLIFDIITSPLGLPINPIYEWIILGVVNLVVYMIAYNKAGDVFADFGIENTGIRIIIHWIIRIFLFICIWSILFGVCKVIKIIGLI